MDWNGILTEVILSIVGVVISTVGGFLVAYIKRKITNEKVQDIVLGALTIVDNAVGYTYQTFVEGIKGTSLWDIKAQEAAMNKSLTYVKENLSKEAVDYITKNYGDLEEWARAQIEIAIKKSKDKSNF